MRRTIVCLSLFISLTAHAGAESYTGPGSDWVSLLLSRASGWSCARATSHVVATAPTAAENRCVRDTYVNAAVQAAWGAECEARAHHTTAAFNDESLMATSLQSAASLCSNAPYVESSGPDTSCNTARIVTCDELAPFQSQPQSAQSIEQQAVQNLDQSTGLGNSAEPGTNIETQALQNLQDSSQQIDLSQQRAAQARAQALALQQTRALQQTQSAPAVDTTSDTTDTPAQVTADDSDTDSTADMADDSGTTSSDDDDTPAAKSSTADDIIDAFKQGMQRGQQTESAPPPQRPARPAASTTSKPTTPTRCHGAGNAVTGEQACD